MDTNIVSQGILEKKPDTLVMVACNEGIVQLDTLRFFACHRNIQWLIVPEYFVGTLRNCIYPQHQVVKKRNKGIKMHVNERTYRRDNWSLLAVAIEFNPN
jgi:hypothetical protein